MTAAPRYLKTGKLSSSANRAELIYRNEIQLTEKKYADFMEWKKMADCGVRRILPFLERLGIFVYGRVLELGAGSCWLTSEISKLKGVEEVYALDFSEVLLEKIAPHMMRHLKAEVAKITCVVGDFNDTCFPDLAFDTVVCDAALHHADDLPRVLKEVHRVLAADGVFIAMREPILSRWTWRSARQKKRFGLHERRQGVTENIYSFQDWENAFRCAGFRTELIPFIHHANLKGKIVKYSPLRFLNGYLFSQYVRVSRKEA